MIEPKADKSRNINMLTIVVVLNGCIACLCWYGVWRLWRLRQALVRITAALTVAERNTQRVLQRAPVFWQQGQVGTATLRLQYQVLLLQVQQVRQILTLLGFGQLVWRQFWKAQGKSPARRQTRSLSGLYRTRVKPWR